MTAHGEVWTDTRCDQLRALWADGLSASQIARELGGDVSRNAVIGKVHRLQLPGRVVTDRAVRKEPGPRRNSSGGAIASIRSRLADRDARARDSFVLEFSPKPALTGVRRLLDLHDDQCRWPVGDPVQPSFFFCGATGADIVKGRPYCGGGHCRRFETTEG